MIDGYGKVFEGKYDGQITKKQQYWISVIENELGIRFKEKRHNSMRAWYFIREHYNKLAEPKILEVKRDFNECASEYTNANPEVKTVIELANEIKLNYDEPYKYDDELDDNTFDYDLDDPEIIEKLYYYK